MILITQPRVGHSNNEIIALQMSARVMEWDVLPSPYSWRMEDDLIASKPKGCPYGSMLFCETIAQQMNWTLKANSFDWLAKVPEKYVKRHIQFMTLGEARKITERKFIKPADTKVFDAKVYNDGGGAIDSQLPDDCPVLVSDPVTWDLEYRCFVDGNDCLTWSNYIYYGAINEGKYHFICPENEILPIEFVSNVMKDIETKPSVIDIGIIPGKGWAVIETNEAWASGLYGCDPSQALISMKMAVDS